MSEPLLFLTALLLLLGSLAGDLCPPCGDGPARGGGKGAPCPQPPPPPARPAQGGGGAAAAGTSSSSSGPSNSSLAARKMLGASRPSARRRRRAAPPCPRGASIAAPPRLSPRLASSLRMLRVHPAGAPRPRRPISERARLGAGAVAAGAPFRFRHRLRPARRWRRAARRGSPRGGRRRPRPSPASARSESAPPARHARLGPAAAPPPGLGSAAPPLLQPACWGAAEVGRAGGRADGGADGGLAGWGALADAAERFSCSELKRRLKAEKKEAKQKEQHSEKPPGPPASQGSADDDALDPTVSLPRRRREGWLRRVGPCPGTAGRPASHVALERRRARPAGRPFLLPEGTRAPTCPDDLAACSLRSHSNITRSAARLCSC